MAHHIPRPLLDAHQDERLQLLTGQFQPTQPPTTEADRIRAAVQREREHMRAQDRANRDACWRDGFAAGQLSVRSSTLGMGAVLGAIVTLALVALLAPLLAPLLT